MEPVSTDIGTTMRYTHEVTTALLETLGKIILKPLFSNLPSGLTPKLRELHRRLTHRLRTCFAGSFSLHRGWTILSILLYISFLIVQIGFRLTISFSS